MRLYATDCGRSWPLSSRMRMEKMNFKKTAQLVQYALKHGLVE